MEWLFRNWNTKGWYWYDNHIVIWKCAYASWGLSLNLAFTGSRDLVHTNSSLASIHLENVFHAFKKLFTEQMINQALF